MSTATMAELFNDPGPFANVYADVSRETEDAVHSVSLQARAVADELRSQGTPAPVISAVEERLAENTHLPNPVSRCVVATANGVLLDETSPVHRPQATVVWDRLPEIAEWLADDADAVSFVLALVDHRGGQVATFGSKFLQPAAAAEVGGPSPWENKVRRGGWSHRNIQRHTETIWARNADEVITEIGHQLRDGVEVLFVGGEPDARRRVLDADQDWRAEMVELEHAGREMESDSEALITDIEENLAARAAARRLRHVHELRDRMGQGQGAATGVREVTDALVKGQVERLLLDPDAIAGTTVQPSDHPGIDLGAVAADAPLDAGRLLIALTIRTDAEPVITPAGTMAGAPAAALLRW